MASPQSFALVSNPDENEGPLILGATLTVSIAALLTVILRLYVRLAIIRNFGWDDGLMTFAMALTIVGQALVIAQVHYGAGRHVGDLSGDDYITGKKFNFISQPVILVAIGVVKGSVGASLLRIAATKFYRNIIIAVLALLAFYTTGGFFTVIFQCTDLRVQWDLSVPSVCWGPSVLKGLSYTNVTLNILTDFLLAIAIPAPMLWSLNVTTRTRVSLLGILGLGLFACVAAAVKTSYLVNYGNLADWLWDSRNITIWTVVELGVGIVAGSLPSLRPLVRNFLGSVYGRGTRKTAGTSSAGAGAGASAYGRGTRRGSSRWHALPGAGEARGTAASQGAFGDESSERGFNISGGDDGVREYELSDQKKIPGTAALRSVVVEAGSSDEDVRKAGHQGINMTTTIVTYSDKRP